MIGTLDIEVQAQNPNFPLDPLYAYVGSPSNIRVRNVPERIGQWNLTQVCIAVNYPDNFTSTFQCVRTGQTWTATLDASTASGLVTNGYSITANGTDEHGEPVSGYVLGRGDVCIMKQDGRVSPGGNGHNMVLNSAKPTAPNVGDVCFEDGVMKTWDGTVWKQPVTKTSQLQNDSDFALNADIARDYTSLELFNQTVGNLEEIISEV